MSSRRNLFNGEKKKKKHLLPGGLEPPTFASLEHPWPFAGTAYKYDALTNCATGAVAESKVQI